MTLQDVPTDHQRSENNARITRKAPSTSSYSINSDSIPSPVGVQSMLRTTTETGDFGQLTFSAPRPQQRISRPRLSGCHSRSFDSSFPTSLRSSNAPRARHKQEQGTCSGQISSTHLLRHSSLRSDLSSHILRPQTRRISPTAQGRRPRNHAIHRPLPGPIRSHKSLVTLRRHGDVGSRYSGSSSNRSGASNILRYYNLPSSEFYISSARHTRSSLAGPNSHTSVTSTPNFKSRYGGNSVYNRNISRSASSLVQLPSGLPNTRVSSTPSFGPLRRGVPGFRSTTPYCVDREGYFARTRYPSIIPDSPHASRYYDYSESFLEKRCDLQDIQCPDTLLAPTAVQDHTVYFSEPDVYRAQTPFGTRLGSAFCPAELPTSYNEQETPTVQDGAAKIQHDSTARGGQRLPFAELAVHEVKHDKDGPIQQEPAELEAPTCRTTLVPRRSRVLSKSGIFFHNGEKSQRDLATLAARVHSPEPESVGRHGKALQVHNSGTHESKLDRKSTSKDPSVTLRRFADQRPKTSPQLAESDTTGILSPRPERPVSSQSRRKFSKIIELDEVAAPTAKEKSSGFVGTIESQPSAAMTIKSQPHPRNDYKKATYGPLPVTVSLNANLESVECENSANEVYPSFAVSHGRSTVGSILDEHIQSLGLLPELRFSSETSDSCNTEVLNLRNESQGNRTLSRTFSWPIYDPQGPLSPMSSGRASSLTSGTRMALKPTRLFAGTDGWLSASKPSRSPRMISQLLVSHRCNNNFARGWQILPSNSQTISYEPLSKLTLTSGDMADIDTEVYPRGCKPWSVSQMSLTSQEGRTNTANLPEKASSHRHRRSKSDPLAKRQSTRRRHVRIRLKQRPGSRWIDEASLALSRTAITLLQTELECAELDGEQPAASTTESRLLDLAGQKIADPEPKRWSSIMAAMPTPITGAPICPRKASVRTQRSQKSYRSQGSLAEPLNSTRQRSQFPRLGSNIPILAPPELGSSSKPFVRDADELRSRVTVSEQGPLRVVRTQSDNPWLDSHSSHREPKRQFGLRPMRTAMQEARRASLLAKAGLPMRNGTPISAIGPFQPIWTRQHPACGPTVPAPETVPMSDFTYRKKRVVGRFKDWWRRQCMQKTLATRGKRTTQSTPGGILL